MKKPYDYMIELENIFAGLRADNRNAKRILRKLVREAVLHGIGEWEDNGGGANDVAHKVAKELIP